MAGVSDNGFEAKRLADVLSDAENELRLITDPVTGQNLQADFASSDPAMQIVKVPLDAVGLNWEAAQLIYQQFDPSKATGPSLETLVELNGLERQPSSASIANLTVTGTPLLSVAAGQLVADSNNVNQWVLEAWTFDGTGTATVEANASVNGPIQAAANTLINIVTPVAGWVSVTNLDPAIAGRNQETITQLRTRRARSTLAPASGPVESVFSNLANISGVTYARVYQNNTLAIDANGITPKSVAAVIVGGDDEDIAFTLLQRTGVTADWFGSTALTLFDVQNEPYTVKWTRPAAVNIFIELDIEVYNASVFPVNGIQLIKDAILAYAIGGAPALGIDDGFEDVGFPPGSLVVLSRLYTPINSVPGHRVVSLKIGLSAMTVGTADIQIDFDKYPQFLDGNIDITVL